MTALRAWLAAFLPAPVLAAPRERIYACAGAGVGLLLTGWLGRVLGAPEVPWLIAPMGASAVLLFGVPSSPLAQPWSIVGGNLVAGVIGVACAQAFGDPVLASGVAVGGAIGVMFALRCLHPPSGAVALIAVLGGPGIAKLGYSFVLAPVLLNSLVMLATALVFNNALRRRYPRPRDADSKHGTADKPPLERVGVTRADLDAAIRAHKELLDVSEADLEDILLEAELRASTRHAGGLRCAHIMSRDLVAASTTSTVLQAWELLQRHKLHALPVLGADDELEGIVTVRDLMHAGPGGSDSPVADVMTREVAVARPQQTLGELVPLFTNAGFHHLPVVGEDRKVLGMVTQSDLVAALHREMLERRSP
ncbi:MAG TPA: HPP family protein [Burkholderiaceae bacterium]